MCRYTLKPPITQYPDAHACIDAIKAGKATCMIMIILADTLRDEVDLIT